jgi:hypothetical protein
VEFSLQSHRYGITVLDTISWGFHSHIVTDRW